MKEKMLSWLRALGVMATLGLAAAGGELMARVLEALLRAAGL